MSMYRALRTFSASSVLRNSRISSSNTFKSCQINSRTAFASQRFRSTSGTLGALRAHSTLPAAGKHQETSSTASSSSSSSAPEITLDVSSQEPVKIIEPRLQMTFTCTVPDCGTRSTHEFTKRAYERGIVLVQCPGCQNRHLIADHLGWFKESTEDGKLKTVEDLLKARGEIIKRGRLHADGDIEYVED
ncbi:hypothetical protein VKT23_002920 [Stygiomarasmius scandens]|uniref:DNL-type domain-containing protein n=1 Tax=Marasmiellus scandens TaxID=2682957 RepID=A0ABR1JWC3_9AGAR